MADCEMKVDWGNENWEDDCSALNKREDLYPRAIQPLLEDIGKGSRNHGSWKLIPPKELILSSGDRSYLGILCRGALLGRVEWEEENSSLDRTSNGRMNILNVIIMSTHSRLR